MAVATEMIRIMPMIRMKKIMKMQMDLGRGKPLSVSESIAGAERRPGRAGLYLHRRSAVLSAENIVIV